MGPSADLNNPAAFFRLSRERGNPVGSWGETGLYRKRAYWVPAFAGMTKGGA